MYDTGVSSIIVGSVSLYVLRVLYTIRTRSLTPSSVPPSLRYPNRTKDYGDPELILLERSVTAKGVRRWTSAGSSGVPDHFQSQVREHPDGGYVVFSNCGKGSGCAGLSAGYLPSLHSDAWPVKMQSVYNTSAVDPSRPWICHLNDWGAEILPDGSVLALFRNGGRHCANGSYPGWPNEQLGP